MTFTTLNYKSILQLFFFSFLFLIICNYAEAAAKGMSQFNAISSWIENNLQGSLGKGISFIALLGLVGNVMINPSKAVLIPLASVLAGIWMGPQVINGLFV